MATVSLDDHATTAKTSAFATGLPTSHIDSRSSDFFVIGTGCRNCPRAANFHGSAHNSRARNPSQARTFERKPVKPSHDQRAVTVFHAGPNRHSIAPVTGYESCKPYSEQCPR